MLLATMIVLVPSLIWLAFGSRLVEAAPPTVLLLILLPLALFVLAEDVRIAAPVRKRIEALGNTAYSSYLIHFPIQLAIAAIFSIFGWAIPHGNPAFFIAFILVTYCSALYLYHRLELPAQELIRNRMLRSASSTRRTASAPTADP